LPGQLAHPSTRHFFSPTFIDPAATLGPCTLTPKGEKKENEAAKLKKKRKEK
jgi:hypothetical protein